MEFLSVNIAIEKNALYAQETLNGLRAKLDSLDSGASDFLSPRLWSLEDGLETFYNEVDQTRFDIINGRVPGKGYETLRLSRIDEKQGALLILYVNFATLKSAAKRRNLIESLAKLKTRFVGVVLFATSDETLELQDDVFPKRLACDFSPLSDEIWFRVVVASCRTRSDGNYVNVEEEREILVDAIAEEIVVNDRNDVNRGLFRLEPDKFSFEVLGGRTILRNDEELAQKLAPRYVGDAFGKIAFQSVDATESDFKTLDESPSQTLGQILGQIPEVEFDRSGESIDDCMENVVFSNEPRIALSTGMENDEILPTLKRLNLAYAQKVDHILERATAQLKRRVQVEANLWRERFVKALFAKESLQTLATSAKKKIQTRFRAKTVAEEPKEPEVTEITSLVSEEPNVWSKIIPVPASGLLIFTLSLICFLIVKDSFSLVVLGIGALTFVVSCCVGIFWHNASRQSSEETIDGAREKIIEFKEYHEALLRKELREKCAGTSKKLEQIVEDYARLLAPTALKIDAYRDCKLDSRPKSAGNKAPDEERYSDFLNWLETSQAKAFNEDVQTFSRVVTAEIIQGLASQNVDVERMDAQLSQKAERRLLAIVKSYGLDVLLRNPFSDPQSGVKGFCRALTPNDKVFASGALIRQALNEIAQNDMSPNFQMNSRIYVSPPRPDASVCQNAQIIVRESSFPNVCVSVQTLTLFFGELSDEERGQIEEIVLNEKEEQQTEEVEKTPETASEENVPRDETTLDELILEKE